MMDQFYADLRATKPLIDDAFVLSCLKPRPQNAHKGNFGALLNIAGSSRYMGAAQLSTKAAMHSGVGYVILASTQAVCAAASITVPESIFLPCEATMDMGINSISTHKILTELQRCTAVLIGCGMGNTEDTKEILHKLLRQSTVPVVIDADGINALAQGIDIIKKANCDIVLTPHMAELARLCGKSVEEILRAPLDAAQKLATDYGITVLLKGSVTAVFAPDGTALYSATGNPGLAKAGSGDVLAGIIGGFLAQGLAPQNAAICGAYVHGKAGDAAAGLYSQTAMTAGDIISHLGAFYRAHNR